MDKDNTEWCGVTAHTLPTPRLGRVLLGAVLIGTLWLGWVSAGTAQAAPPRWDGPVIATWYGPGFYGHRFACANHPDLPSNYARRTRGVAHRTLPCGTRLTLNWGGRSVQVRVIDRGPYSGATFDLTARTAQDLCHCWAPFTFGTGGIKGVRWHRGWAA